MTADLVAFLRARLDEDEQAASAAKDADTGRWFVGDKWNVYDRADETPYDDVESNPLIAYGNMLARSEHIATWDPTRVLAEVDAKRRVIDHLDAELDNANGDNPWWYSSKLRPVLELLALPYAAHPDYREEWRP